MLRPLLIDWRALALLALLAVGCSFDKTPPAGTVHCRSTAQCPSPLKCQLELGVCVPTLDTTAPFPTAAPTFVYQPATTSVQRAPTALSAFSTAGLTVDVDEPLANAELVPQGACEGWVQCTVDRLSLAAGLPMADFSCNVSTPAPVVEATCAVELRLTDGRGLTSATPLPSATLSVDTLAPSAPPVDTPDAVVLERTPWNTGGASASARVSWSDAPADLQLAVYSGLDTGASLLGQGAAASVVALSTPSLPRVAVESVDEAGNTSPRVLVRDVTVHVGFGADPSDAGNPNRLEQRLTHSAFLLQGDRPNSAGASYEASGAATTGGGVWTERRIGDIIGQCGAASTYDSARGRVQAFGGIPCPNADGSPNAHLLEWNGEQWIAQVTASPSQNGEPPATANGALSYDEQRQTTVLFGGDLHLGDAGFSDQTWLFQGSTWARVATDGGGPSARAGHAMAFDPARRRVVLFGGRLPDGTLLGDTWEWNGAAWSEQHPAQSPAARASFAMANAPGLGGVVVHGGLTLAVDGGREASSDAWLFDGSGWRELPALEGPAPLAGHVLISNPRRAALELVVGELGDGGLARLGCPLDFSAPTGRTRVWRATDGGWAATGAALVGCRSEAIAARDEARDTLVVAGGRRDLDVIFLNIFNATISNTETWLWNGAAAWSLKWKTGGLASVPPARLFHAMTYDSVHAATVIQGGDANGVPLDDTWAWNGVLWHKVTGAPAGPRRYHSMAFDPAGKRVVLFGGIDEVGSVSTQVNTQHGAVTVQMVDAGTYALDLDDDAGWRRLPVASPDARLMHTLATLGPSGPILMVGGANALKDIVWQNSYFELNSGDSVFTDSWIFNGTWSPVPKLDLPVTTFNAGAAFGVSNGRIVVLQSAAFLPGKVAPGQVFEQSYAGADGGWTRSLPPSPVHPRLWSSLTYDTDRQRVISLAASGDDDSFSLADRIWDWDPANQRWDEVPVSNADDEGMPSPSEGARFAFDQARGRTVVYGGFGGRLWELQVSRRQPGHVFLVSLSDLGATETTEIGPIRFEVEAGGAGQTPASDGGWLYGEGVAVLPWHDGAWSNPIATGTGGPTSPASVGADFPSGPGLLAPGARLAVAVVPRGATGPAPAKVFTRNAELHVHLRFASP